MPVRNVLIGDSRGNIEHDDTTVTIDVVTVSQPSKLLLASSIPYIELKLAEVGEETKRAIKKKLISHRLTVICREAGREEGLSGSMER